MNFLRTISFDCNFTLASRMPARLYKFLHRCDLAFIKDSETLRIGSSEYYRRRFSELEDPTIFDPDEGTLHLEQIRPLGPIATKQEQYLFGMNIERVAPNLVSHGNRFILRNEDFHLLCFAKDPFDRVARALCSPRPSGQEPYDTALQIDNPQALAEAIITRGRLLDLDGSEVCDMGTRWGRLEGGSVRYQPLTSAAHLPFPVQDGFLKAPLFAGQQEYRLKLHWTAEGPTTHQGEAFTIRVPGLWSYMREVPLPDAAATLPTEP